MMGIPVVSGILLLVMTALSFFSTNSEPNTCSMSYSRPVFYPIEFTSPSSKVSTRYHTYLYREGGVSRHYDGPEALGGTPVLFIPGNAGSYSQGRSIAALAANMAKDEHKATEFDFFLIHFSEDLSAMHGKTLVDEAEYVNDAIFHILSLYASDPKFETPPTSVIIVSHSMGGIVARTLVTLDNYLPNSVNTILTLSTPHLVPPLTFDWEVTGVYDRVNQYWRTSYTHTNESAAEHLNPLKDLSLISISGGHTDHMIPADYTLVDSIAPADHALAAYTYAIPSVWRGIDHLAIVWCFELRQVIVESLFAISDPTSPSRTLPLKERMATLNSIYKSPLDALPANATIIWRENDGFGSPSPMGNLYVGQQGDKLPIGLHMPVDFQTIKSGLLKYIWGVTVPVFNRWTDIDLQGVKSSLITLNVKVVSLRPQTNADSADVPLSIRHWTPKESRWHQGDSARTIWYSASPYTPFDTSVPRNLHVQVIAPLLTDNGPSYIAKISIDWWASLANVATSYRTVGASFPLAVTLACFLIQLRGFYNHDYFSFDKALDTFTSQYLGDAAKFLMVAHLLLCFKLPRDLVRRLQIPSESLNMAALLSPALGNFDIHDMLVGVDDPNLFFLAPLLLLISTALVYVVHKVLSTLVRCNGFVQSKYLPSYSQSPQLPQALRHHFMAYIAGNVLWLAALFFIPYQVVFLASLVWLALKTTDPVSWQYTFVMVLLWTSVTDAPIVAVWMHNLNFEWTLAFSTYRNISSAAPIVALVFFLSKQPSPIPPPCDSRWLRGLTYLAIVYMVYYTLFYGVMHAFMMHHLVNFFAFWMLFLYLWSEPPEPKKVQ